GKEVIRTPDDALGYVEKEVSGKVMDIRQVSVEKASEGIGWGAVYAEFEEDLDEVAAQGNALKVSRTLYKDGQALPEGAELQVGDKLTVRLKVTADRDMDFVQVKDERAACMEPVDALSGYRWNRTVGYYLETKDASTSFYMDQLRKGTHVLEYEVYITSSGRYSQGIATAQSVYAPEFVGHGVGGRLTVK
ncbi:MAG: alpha-2-macroglobulin, partial [Bacteroides sp.]|nr:alpha-2-macroglobulin [Bacteroides sp.]